MPFLGPNGPAPNQISAFGGAQSFAFGPIEYPTEFTSVSFNIYGKPNVTVTLTDYLAIGTRSNIDLFYTRIRLEARFNDVAFRRVFDAPIMTPKPPGQTWWDESYGAPQFYWSQQFSIAASEIRVVVIPYKDEDPTTLCRISGKIIISATA